MASSSSWLFAPPQPQKDIITVFTGWIVLIMTNEQILMWSVPFSVKFVF